MQRSTHCPSLHKWDTQGQLWVRYNIWYAFQISGKKIRAESSTDMTRHVLPTHVPLVGPEESNFPSSLDKGSDSVCVLDTRGAVIAFNKVSLPIFLLSIFLWLRDCLPCPLLFYRNEFRFLVRMTFTSLCCNTACLPFKIPWKYPFKISKGFFCTYLLKITRIRISEKSWL